jgi:signal transduction histidine kinase
VRDAKYLSRVQSPAAAEPQPENQDAQLCAAITKLAELGRTALGARACVVAWEAPGGAAEASSAGAAAVEELDSARVVLAAIAQGAGARAREFRAAQLAPNLAALGLREGSAAVRVAAAGGAARTAPKAEAILELVGRAAIAAVAAAESARSRAFWRGKAAAALEQTAALAETAAAREAGLKALEGAAARIAALDGAGRFAAMGEAVALALGCRKWLVAAPRDGGLRIVAAARGIARPRELDEASAISECSRTGRLLIRLPGFAAPRALPEDKILGAAWIVFGSGPAVIGLAEGDLGAAGFSARAEAIGARLAPILRAWTAEDALERNRALVGRLALRMYAAIDDERARIARDLHDDQAQLLAAAQIALEGGGDEAREIFRQIANELRARIRGLKPPALERITLAEALEAELERMRGQGIDGHLLRGKGAARISAPVQRLCWQVAREALANVARHSGANSVEVEIGRDERYSRVTVRDNGRGIRAGADAAMGIGGIKERLELMGGKLEIESSPSGTILSAEIPEPA